MEKSIFLFASAILLCISLSAQTKSEYKIVNRFPIEGEGGWDYLVSDDATGRLFISHGTVVQVVDAKSGKLIATIHGLNGVHGIALAPEFNKGFITSGRDSTVLVFDVTKYTTLSKIKMPGANPDAIVYDSFSKKVFVCNGRSSSATVLDASSGKIIETIPLDGKPEASVSDEKGKIYVNIEDKSEVCMLNTSTLKVEQVWSIKPGEEPSGLALDNAAHRLFSVCDKMMVVLDATTGKIITTVPIGDRVDDAAFDPVLKRAYSSNGEGTMTVVQEENADSFKVLENVGTQKGARTICLNRETHHIYLSAAEFGETPEKTKENPRPRPTIKPNSFVILDMEQSSGK